MKFKKVLKMNSSKSIDAIIHYKDWLFVDSEISNIEILKPTLPTVELMKQYNMKFVLKGFKSVSEYRRYENLRFKFGFYSAMYATRLVGGNFMSNTIMEYLSNDKLPTNEEINQAIESNKFILVKNEKTEKKVFEKNKYKKLYEKYSKLAHKYIYELIKQHRLVLLTNVLEPNVIQQNWNRDPTI